MAEASTQILGPSSGLLKAALVPTILGALNWGLVGIFNWNLVNVIFGGSTRSHASSASRVIYAIVGIAGLIAAFLIPWGTKETVKRLALGEGTVRKSEAAGPGRSTVRRQIDLRS
jgi:uncharacterized membrane protein YuzA (DUF378 family)